MKNVMSDTMIHSTGLGGHPRSRDRQRVVALVGDPRGHSRTAALASAVAVRLAREVVGGSKPESAWKLIELNGWSQDRSVYDWLTLVQEADLLVVASPIRRASFTGLLKSFLDLLPDQALGGSVAVPVMVSQTMRHSLAADVHLRPVLQDLGASCPTASLFALESRLSNPGAICASWFNRSRSTLAPFAAR
ncbi:MAG: reductase [Solirubrobacterales bacterium]|jgi:FMN reductase|nr:reductase [Solirubrobacterales bacterium]